MDQNLITGFLAFVLGFLVLALLFLAYRQKGQNDIKRVLIERFGAAQDLGAFLQSEGGQRFLAGLATEVSNPLTSVMASMQKGIILVLLGVGCLVASLALNSHEVAAIGLVLACVGVGFLVSAAAALRLAKKWGLLDKPADIRPKDLGK